jgi:hypothetical protein
MTARRACRSLSQGVQQGVSRGGAMLPIKASCAMSGDRSSAGQRASSASQPNRSDPTMSPATGLSLAGQHYAAHGFAAETRNQNSTKQRIARLGPLGPLVWLAGRVVPWHTFNLVRFAWRFSRRVIRSIRPPPSGQRLGLHCRCIDLCEHGLHVCLAWHCRSLSKVRDENSSICRRAAQQARGTIERNR